MQRDLEVWGNTGAAGSLDIQGPLGMEARAKGQCLDSRGKARSVLSTKKTHPRRGVARRGGASE